MQGGAQALRGDVRFIARTRCRSRALGECVEAVRLFRIVVDHQLATQRIAVVAALEVLPPSAARHQDHLTVVQGGNGSCAESTISIPANRNGVFDNAINIRDTVFDLGRGRSVPTSRRARQSWRSVAPLAQFGGVEDHRLAAVFINEISILVRASSGARSGIGVRACHAVSVSTRVGARATPWQRVLVATA